MPWFEAMEASQDGMMSAHVTMPRTAWIFPALAVLFFAGATALGLTFTPSAGGLIFTAALLVGRWTSNGCLG